MADRFGRDYAVYDSSAYDAFSVTTGNTEFSQPTRALYVGETGNVHVQMLSYDNANTEVTFVNVPSGATLPIRVKKVFANTTANSIIGLY